MAAFQVTDRFPGTFETRCDIRPKRVPLTDVEELEGHFLEADRALRVALR